MATWRKLILSGSDAELRSLDVTTDIAVGSNQIISTSSADTKLSGSFTGSFTGNVTATSFSFDIDSFGSDLTGNTLVGTDKILVSDGGTDGRAEITQLASPLAGTGLEADSGTIRVASTAAGSGLTGGSGTALSVDTSSGHFITGSTKAMDLRGVFSSSGQVDVRDTTGIATIATTGSNSFTGVQTITNTTNSTNYTDGALIVQGGVGIAKDVNISGSLNVEGLLTVVSMSTQYVTSSQYTVGTSRIILNDDDLVRFAGLSVIDSGSTAGSGSLFWDSLKNHWIYENETGAAYNSAILIAGPKNYGTLGDEEELVVGRIPVATGGDHIDTNIASSSLRVDLGTLETHVEHGLYITGSVTASVGFKGDGSQLTGIVTSLTISGSESGTTSIELKTEDLIVSGGEGIDVNVTNNTITISGEDASTSNKGIASFNSSYFTVSSGDVAISASAITATQLNTSVAGTGLSGGGGTALSVDYGSTSGTAVEGNTNITINGTTNEIEITGTAAQALGSGPSYTIGLPTDVTVAGKITASTGSFVGDVVIDGDLTVNGTTTTISTQNLLVEDKFILLASGSNSSTDGGIIIDAGNGTGHSLFYDSDATRWGVNESLAHSASSAAPTAYVAQVVDMQVAAQAAAVTTYSQLGNIKIDNGEIYIWA